MKVVVAPNAFKGSLSAKQATEAISRGIGRVSPDIQVVGIPIADGGDGLFDIFEDFFAGERREKSVTGPLGNTITAEYLFIPSSKTAVVEMARASGLALLGPEERDVRGATSKGTGELILDAIANGASRVIVGIGGSATNDGGMGVAQALGVDFFDVDGQRLPPIGDSLPRIRRIDMRGLRFDPGKVAFEVVCDVDNPLCGPRGAAAVYGPQKGASPEDIHYLDEGLATLAMIIKDQLGLDIADLPGAGAAGGLGAGLVAFANASLRPGIDVVLDMVNMDSHLEDADLVLTAEGGIDFQTAFGKGPAGVGLRARKYNLPCVALAGNVSLDIGNLHDCGITAAFSLCNAPMTLEDSIDRASMQLEWIAEQVMRTGSSSSAHDPGAQRRTSSRAGPPAPMGRG